MWNIVDSLVLFLGFCFLILEVLILTNILSPASVAIKLFFSILNLLFFIKLISFIRGFKEMGFLIRTIIVVAGDIVYFLIVLVLFIAMIAFSSKYFLKNFC